VEDERLVDSPRMSEFIAESAGLLGRLGTACVQPIPQHSPREGLEVSSQGLQFFRCQGALRLKARKLVPGCRLAASNDLHAMGVCSAPVAR